MTSLNLFARWGRLLGCLAFIPGVAITAFGAEVVEAESASQPTSYVWHLAVLNGGQPRGAKPTESITIETSPFVTALTADDLIGETFGPVGSTPIAGDFDGDGNSDIGAFRDGQWWIDLSGNGLWDANDLWVSLGSKGDQPITGDWDGDGKTDIGVFGPAWEGDVASTVGLPDAERAPALAPAVASIHEFHWQRGESARPMSAKVSYTLFFGNDGDQAIAGDFNGDGIDTVGVYRGGRWLLDIDGDGRLTGADKSLEFGTAANRPLIGDFNGDGIDELAVWSGNDVHVYGVGQLEAPKLARAGDVPVAGDFHGQGHDEVVLYRTIQ